MIDTTELMKQVGRIKILTTHLIDDRLSGDYHSVFKGYPGPVWVHHQDRAYRRTFITREYQLIMTAP